MGIGDVLMVQQVALPSVRKSFPNAHITFWTSESGARILHGNPHIDRIEISDWIHGTNPTVRPLPEMLEYDVVINLINKVDFLPIVTKTNRPDNFFNVAKQQVYDQTSISLKKIKDNHKISVSNKSIEWYHKICLRNEIDSNVIGCALNSHGDMRYYPLQKWIDLANICPDKTFVWFGDRPELGQVKDVPNNVINTGGRLNFSEFITMWMGCAICIGPDSGGMNISGTNNQDYIALIGSTKAKDHIINYNSVSTITAKPKLRCSPCYDWQVRNDCAGKGIPWCMDEIEPKQIKGTIDVVLEKKKKKGFFSSTRNYFK